MAISKQTFLRPSALILVVALNACGGGGGDSSAPIVETPVTPPQTTSGLVPPSSTLGATLVADATTLRPLVTNGLWTYRGVETSIGASAAPKVYVNTVSHQAGSGGAVNETATNLDGAGIAQQSMFYRSGEVRSSTVSDSGNGQTQVVEQLELRSPVRVNDQYIIEDSHVVDSGIDLDGDRKNDAFDLAIYTRVIGEELVDLVSYLQARTVHVQTVVVARFKLSSTGAYTETASGTLDNWYLAGVGVVKRGSNVPGNVAGSRLVTAESLVNWDGVSRGVGFLDTKPAVISTGVRLKYVQGAVGFDTHALMMTFAGQASDVGIALSKVDARGAVTSTRMHSGISAARAQLVRIGDGVRVIAANDAGIQMYSYDAAGVATAAGPVQLKAGVTYAASRSPEFVVAGVGNTLWVAWVEPAAPGSGTYELLSQPFDAAGQPLAMASILTPVWTPMAIENLKATGGQGHAIFMWDQALSLGWGARYAVMDGTGAVTPSLHGGGIRLGGTPVVLANGPAVLWAAIQGITGIGFTAAAEPLELPKLMLPWLGNTQGSVIGSGTGLDAYAQTLAKLWPEDTLEAALSVVFDISPGAGGLLAADTPVKVLARGVYPLPTKMVRLTASVLAISDLSDGVAVTSVWRRP